MERLRARYERAEVPRTGELARGVLLLLVVLIITIIAAVVGGAIIQGAINTNQHSVTGDPEPGQTVRLSHSIQKVPAETSVYATTGNAVSVAGTSDSNVSWRVVDEVEHGPWTACTYAEVGDGANLDATMDVVALVDGAIQLEFDAGHWAVYYSNGTHDAYARAAAPAPTDPETVCGRYDGTSLELWVDGNQQASATLTTGPATRNTSVPFEGTLDEIRVTNDSVPAARLATYDRYPAVAFDDGRAKAARLMLDEGSGTTSRVYFETSNATLHNATWTDGVSRTALAQSGNYSWATDPWGIVATDGGYLDDAPVVYVDYRAGGSPFGAALLAIRDLLGVGFVLMSIGMITIPAVTLVAYLLSSEMADLGSFGSNRR